MFRPMILYLQVRKAVLEEDVPVVEEELLLTNTQQACHQGIQSLGIFNKASENQKSKPSLDKL